MKYLARISLLLSLILTLGVASAAAPVIDLSAMTYDEMLALKDQLNLAMWNSKEWQEVTVPQGIWEIGVDIPAGKWAIWAEDGAWISIEWGKLLDDYNTEISFENWIDGKVVFSPNSRSYDPKSSVTHVDWNLTAGTYISVRNGNAVFKLSEGKPSLSFK